jgi:hypothetical protein
MKENNEDIYFDQLQEAADHSYCDDDDMEMESFDDRVNKNLLQVGNDGDYYFDNIQNLNTNIESLIVSEDNPVWESLLLNYSKNCISSNVEEGWKLVDPFDSMLLFVIRQWLFNNLPYSARAIGSLQHDSIIHKNSVWIDHSNNPSCIMFINETEVIDVYVYSCFRTSNDNFVNIQKCSNVIVEFLSQPSVIPDEKYAVHSKMEKVLIFSSIEDYLIDSFRSNLSLHGYQEAWLHPCGLYVFDGILTSFYSNISSSLVIANDYEYCSLRCEY